MFMHNATPTRLMSITAVLWGTLASAQTTWFVSNDPSENPDFPTISAAVASPSVLGGDTLVVSEGVGPYTGGIMISKFLMIVAEAGEQPTVTPAGIGTPVYCFRQPSGAPGIRVEGLRFLGPRLYVNGIFEGGIWDETSTTVVENCVFEGLDIGISGNQGTVRESEFVDNRIGVAGARLVEGCTFSILTPLTVASFVGANEIIDCRFTGPAQIGGADFGGTRFVRCRFEDIEVPATYAAFVLGDNFAGIFFDSCLFAGVHSTASIVDLGFRAIVEFRGCTVVGCSAPDFVRNVGGLPGMATMSNTILRDNDFQSLFQTPPDISYSILPQNFPGPGNLVTDPLFSDPANGDYSLKRGSPAIDAGDSAAVPPDVTIDLLGNSRRVDDPIMPDTGDGPQPIVDIGAFEFQPPGPGFCQADLTTGAILGVAGYGTPNGIVNNDDFFYYLILYASSNGCGVGPGQTRCPSPPDLTTSAVPGTPGYGVLNGIINNDDFFYFLTVFAAGC